MHSSSRTHPQFDALHAQPPLQFSIQCSVQCFASQCVGTFTVLPISRFQHCRVFFYFVSVSGHVKRRSFQSMLPLPSTPILAPHYCQFPFFSFLQPRHHTAGGRVDYFLGTLYKTGVVVGKQEQHNTFKQSKKNTTREKKQKEICVSNPKEIQSIFLLDVDRSPIGVPLYV